mgnify:CR=1 FL=1
MGERVASALLAIMVTVIAVALLPVVVAVIALRAVAGLRLGLALTSALPPLTETVAIHALATLSIVFLVEDAPALLVFGALNPLLFLPTNMTVGAGSRLHTIDVGFAPFETACFPLSQ